MNTVSGRIVRTTQARKVMASRRVVTVTQSPSRTPSGSASRGCSSTLGSGYWSSSGPIRSDGGLHIVALVDRRAAQADALTREQISERLVRDRLDLMARGYLRDLRRSAYVDIRQ